MGSSIKHLKLQMADTYLGNLAEQLSSTRSDITFPPSKLETLTIYVHVPHQANYFSDTYDFDEEWGGIMPPDINIKNAKLVANIYFSLIVKNDVERRFQWLEFIFLSMAVYDRAQTGEYKTGLVMRRTGTKMNGEPMVEVEIRSEECDSW